MALSMLCAPKQALHHDYCNSLTLGSSIHALAEERSFCHVLPTHTSPVNNNVRTCARICIMHKHDCMTQACFNRHCRYQSSTHPPSFSRGCSGSGRFVELQPRESTANHEAGQFTQVCSGCLHCNSRHSHTLTSFSCHSFILTSVWTLSRFIPQRFIQSQLVGLWQGSVSAGMSPRHVHSP